MMLQRKKTVNESIDFFFLLHSAWMFKVVAKHLFINPFRRSYFDFVLEVKINKVCE